jgi:uncharacterized repeat protein (TIGR01451 family)
MRKHRRVGLLTCSVVTVFGLGAIALMPGDSGAQAPITPSAGTSAGSRIRVPSPAETVTPAAANNPYAPPTNRYAENPIRRTAGEAPEPTSAPVTAPPSVAIPVATTPAPSTASLPRYAPPTTAAPPQNLPPQTLPADSGLGATSLAPGSGMPAAVPPATTPATAPSTLSPYPPSPSASPYRAAAAAPNPLPTSSPFPAAPAPAPATSPYADAAMSAARSNPITSEGTGRPGELALEGPQQPTLTVEKLAPPEIQVGKPALFEVRIRNAGQATAHDIVVTDLVPKGTTLTKTSPPAETIPGGGVRWKIGALRPGDETVLAMELMPLTEGEIGSTASVQFSAAAAARTICTKPELAIEVQAPRNVQAGDDVPLHIRIFNSGSGVAAGVLLTEVVPANMVHEGGNELEYDVGDLQPGQTRELELVLRAVKPGQVMNLLHAKGEGKLAAEAKTPIEIVAPQLSLAVEGPKKRYLDRQATYTVSIANPGTASARDVELATYLPRGMQFVDANNNGEYDAATHSVRWLLEELPARERGSVQITTLPVEPGQQLLRVETTAERGVQAQKEEAILVEGAASIAFQVVDTADPIEVGGETTYEIRVTNQGSKEATNVQLAVSLPDGLKAIDADGPTRFTMNGRQVQFQALAQLPPKGETIYRIRVQCMAAGDHRCHVQLLSDDMRTPVTKEEGTRVYADE